MGQNPLGSLTLRSQAVPGGLKFTTLALTGAHLSLTGKGSWRWANAGPRSAFSLTAQGRDLGRFLRSLELESLFQEAPGTLNLDLSWPGAPGRFAAAELQGRIRIDLGAGRLLDVEPGVGRILGLLNLGVLRRRLALDFNDLFGRGFDFERIAGRIQIHKGVATIEELLIEGPSADLGITGNAHLVTRELDQIVTVTPHLGASVAVAGAVAGGPWSARPSSRSTRYPAGRSTGWAATSTTSADPGPGPGSSADHDRTRPPPRTPEPNPQPPGKIQPKTSSWRETDRRRTSEQPSRHSSRERRNLVPSFPLDCG